MFLYTREEKRREDKRKVKREKKSERKRKKIVVHFDLTPCPSERKGENH
jgi:hypothetical protein